MFNFFLVYVIWVVNNGFVMVWVISVSILEWILFKGFIGSVVDLVFVYFNFL